MTYTPLKPKTHLIFWTAATAAFVLIVFLLKTVLLPFVLGLAIAYLLNPFVTELGKAGLSRSLASLLILGGFVLCVLALGAVLLPALVRESADLIQNAPDYVRHLIETLKPLMTRIEGLLGMTHEEAVDNLMKNGSGPAVKTLDILARNLLAGGQAVIDAISVIVIMPIVAYFLMKDWPDVTAWIHGLIPRHAEESVNGILKNIDAKLSGFVRGQLTVALILGVAYALALTLAGLKYGFMIGLGSGALSIIPMVGSAVGLVLSIAVAWFQSGNLAFVLLIGGIFIAGQIIEGNLLTPKLIGDSVGLHPLWIFFALMAGASLLGVLGMFLAVPVTASIGVVTSFLLQKYKDSRYYNDLIPESSGGPANGRKAARGRKKKLSPENEPAPPAG
ncbi:MAG: AI-2E family transporter [Alphaproteobacteria bacterium]|nr:AI-2E family transporter [Alphaproteobacteria bacterium]MBP7758998.1 AI-2E family transporter [Alphaproteobacteria bacterium]MBP7762272.1 AI-2E family transporter [Alphaproteobacteria bacterium]MBP7904832.1 AI-2E family transporter [Alphaproteobacteria bacterium]